MAAFLRISAARRFIFLGTEQGELCADSLAKTSRARVGLVDFLQAERVESFGGEALGRLPAVRSLEASGF